jgi:hypothetical protein
VTALRDWWLIDASNPTPAASQRPATVIACAFLGSLAGSLVARGISRRRDQTLELGRLLDELRNLSEMGELESLRLQMAMDRTSKFIETLSNLLKKISETESGIVQNLK